MTSPWQSKDQLVCATLRENRSLIFVGGRGSGTTTLVRSVEEQLSQSREVRALYLRPGSPVLSDVGTFVAELTGVRESGGVPSVPRIDAFVRERLREQECSGLVLLVDGLHLLGEQEWGVDLVDFLRAVISECSQVTIGLFGRPSLKHLFDGKNSPLSNVCSRVIASVADSQRVRAYYAAQNVGADLAMRGYRLVGGTPALIGDAVQAVSDGATDVAAATQVAQTRSDWLEAQNNDLDPRAREAVVVLCDGPLTVDGLAERLGRSPVDEVLTVLEAHLLIAVHGGQVRLQSEVHRVWLSAEVARRRLATRMLLSRRDPEAYRIISELEWRAREWICQRLSQASPDDWWETRIPSDPRRRAETRHNAERASGVVEASAALIDYLDFSDVREIIRYSPNWTQLFAKVLGEWRPTLEEAIVRIEATRRKVAHSRPLTEQELVTLSQDARLVIDLLAR